MSYEVAPLILYSQDRTRMLNFLSDVFEFEVREEDFSVFHRELSFKIENLLHLKDQSVEFVGPTPFDHKVIFTFRIKGEDQFEEIINKFNFFLYRRAALDHQEKIIVTEDQNARVILISDIDGRTWKFEFKKALL